MNSNRMADVEREVDELIPRGDLTDNIARSLLGDLLLNSRGSRPQVHGTPAELRDKAYEIARRA